MISANRRQYVTEWFLQALAITAIVMFFSTYSLADSRFEAKADIDFLQQAGTAQIKPNDLGSIESTFSIAEHYLQQNNRELAERFYLLTIQKIRILKSELAGETPELEQHEPLMSTSDPQTSYFESSHDTVPLLLPSETETVPQKPLDNPLEETKQITAISKPKTTDNQERDSISSNKLVGNANTYTVIKNDTLRLIAAKLGVSTQHLTKMNKLDQKAMLKIGQQLRFNNRKIVPQRMSNGIVINIPDRTLYYFNNGRLDISLPVALGVPIKNEKYDWTTPTGKFTIIAKQKDPTWHVPPSIQSEMEENGKDVITSIPPGPTNPLGKYAMKTSLPGILIHSTTKPWSIYSFASHGCIRVYPGHMEEFFKKIRVNTPGEIIYRPVKLALTEDGRVFLEVHRDAYGKSAGLHIMAKQLIEKHKLANRVDWVKVESVIRLKAGFAEDITL